MTHREILQNAIGKLQEVYDTANQLRDHSTPEMQEECICGLNAVYPCYVHVKWKDFSKVGIRRVKDRKTGKIFLSMKINFDVCKGHYEDEEN
jgi:hypothetical protein